MKEKVVGIRDFKILLKDLERYIRAPDFLRKGRVFPNFALRPREVLANWLLCAVANFEHRRDKYTFTTDPTGGDGIICSREGEHLVLTEHDFVPEPKAGNSESVEDQVVRAIEHKKKKGAAYAKGKHLVVFSEAVGRWYPNRVAKRIADSHGFSSVWVVHLEKGDDSEYIYCIALLDLSKRNAPSWKVFIASTFDRWRVQRIQ